MPQEAANIPIAYIGSVGEYDSSKELFDNYKKRFDVWCTVNRVQDANKGQVFLALIGASAFELLTTLTIPDDVTNKTYVDMCTLLSNYHKTSKNKLTERINFRERKQKPNEGVAEYIVDLKKLTKHCNYGDQLEENLLETFTKGLSDVATRRKLWAKAEMGTLTWKDAQAEALAMEAATREADPGKSQAKGNVDAVTNQSRRGGSKKHQYSGGYRGQQQYSGGSQGQQQYSGGFQGQNSIVVVLEVNNSIVVVLEVVDHMVEHVVVNVVVETMDHSNILMVVDLTRNVVDAGGTTTLMSVLI